MSDFIETFLAYTEGLPSPRVFRIWAAIGALCGAAERRIWSQGIGGPIFPNLYAMLLGRPAGGKTIVLSRPRDLLLSIPAYDIHIAPESATKASFLDFMQDHCYNSLISRDGEVYEFTSVFVCSTEFGNFIKSYDDVFLNLLIELYDNPDRPYEDKTRHSGNAVLRCPNVSIFAATTPGYLGSLLPEQAWTTGFMSRTIIIYSDEKIVVPILGAPPEAKPQKAELVTHLSLMTKRLGEIAWESEAKNALEAWRSSGLAPAPVHPKLATYASRRDIITVKLSMLMALSRNPLAQSVTLEDFERAQALLLDTERPMADVFSAMTYRSEGSIIDDAVAFIRREFARSGAPVGEKEFLRDFLNDRAPLREHDRIRNTLHLSGLVGVNDRREFTPLTIAPKKTARH